MIIFLLLLLSALYSTAYDKKCPEPSQWRLTASSKCPLVNNYTCLLLSIVNISRYEEVCSEEDISDLGTKLVFQPYKNQANCAYHRYQPYIFTTVGNSDCVYQKSKCNEEGQIVFNNGTLVNDTLCQCDYSGGYSFVKTPTNPCYCIPTLEDCSCYKSSNFPFSGGYFDNNKTQFLSYTKCEQREIFKYTQIVTVLPNQYEQYKNVMSAGKENSMIVVYLISIGGCLLGLILVTAHLLKKHFEKPKLVLKKTSHRSVCGRPVKIECDLISQKELLSVEWYRNNDIVDLKNYDKYSFQMGRNATLTINKVDQYDTGTYTCSVKTSKGSGKSKPFTLTVIDVNISEEERHCVRIIIIGKDGVGKTSLTKRLLWSSPKEIKNINSTDGIDIAIKKCEIDIVTGKWIQKQDTGGDLVKRLHSFLAAQPEHVAEKDTISKSDTLKVPQDKNAFTQLSVISTSAQSKPDMEYLQNQPKDEINTKKTNPVLKVNVEDSVVLPVPTNTDTNIATEYQSEKLGETATLNSAHVFADGNIIEDPVHLTDKTIINVQEDIKQKMPTTTRSVNELNEEEDMSTENISRAVEDANTALINSVWDKHESSSKKMASCWLWDFAGQIDFYATHQAFLASCAVYLLVIDIRDDIICHSNTVERFKHAGDYIDFWLNSIHCYWSRSRKGDKLDPPVIVVFTNEDAKPNYKDKGQKESTKSAIDEQFMQLGEKHRSHIRHVVTLSNINEKDDDFENLRQLIFEEAKQLKEWGEKQPLKWIFLEKMLDEIRQKYNVITYKELFNIARNETTGISQEAEFSKFLTSQNDIGNIIYFSDYNLRGYIILNPKWLVQAFRCLISNKIDDEIKMLGDWKTLKETGEMTTLLFDKLLEKRSDFNFIEHKNHIIEVMKKFDILVPLRNKGLNDSLYMPCIVRDANLENLICNLNMDMSSWLCFEFDFLPPAFFNHVVVKLIKTYTLTESWTKEQTKAKPVMYQSFAAFDLVKSKDEKLVVCVESNIIGIQILSSNKSFRELKTYAPYVKRMINDFIKFLVEERYKMNITHNILLMCAKGNLTAAKWKYADLSSENECYCSGHCRESHTVESLVFPWYMDYCVEMTPAV